jgi:hypothetical protein
MNVDYQDHDEIVAKRQAEMDEKENKNKENHFPEIKKLVESTDDLIFYLINKYSNLTSTDQNEQRKTVLADKLKKYINAKANFQH